MMGILSPRTQKAPPGAAKGVGLGLSKKGADMPTAPLKKGADMAPEKKGAHIEKANPEDILSSIKISFIILNQWNIV